MIYLKFAKKLLNGVNKETAYSQMREEIKILWNNINFPETERTHFNRLIQNNITKVKINNLKTGGYIIKVLESSIWFLLKSKSYKETILSIINLGSNTDTSAAIAGGLAGIYYQKKGIPKNWTYALAKMKDIFELGEKLNSKNNNNNYKIRFNL